MEHRIEKKQDYFNVRARGTATSGGLISMISDLFGHPDWKPGSKILLDYTELDSSPLTVAEIRDLVLMLSENRSTVGRVRIAHLVGRDLEWGMIRMWEAYLHENWDGISTSFREMTKAIAWLAEVKD